jgi:two-component system response regulator BaeR
MNESAVLLVEDEATLAEVLSAYLSQAGFTVQVLSRGDQVLPWLAEHKVDLLILDVMLPGLDGFELTRRIRTSSRLPILLTTARVEEGERIAGLGLGADDYICKPYSPREVVARVQAVLRRVGEPVPVNVDQALSLDAQGYRVCRAGQVVQLTAVEFRLMQVMRRYPGRIFSRQQLMDQIYLDGRVVSERTVDSRVKKLRRKIESLGGGEQIEAVYGLGYRISEGGAVLA